MNKDDSLRFKVSVSPTYAELHKQLEVAGPYYRSRRMLSLALLGLSLEKGHIVTSAPTPISTNTSSDAQPNLDRLGHYSIPDDAAEAIGKMFDSLDKSLDK